MQTDPQPSRVIWFCPSRKYLEPLPLLPQIIFCPVAKPDLLAGLAVPAPWGVLLEMEGPDCLQLAITVRQLAPAVHLVLVLPPDVSLVRLAQRINAAGLLARTGVWDTLPACLDEVAQGYYFLDPALLIGEALPSLAHLRPRELEVLIHLAHGLPAAQIANKLFLSLHTVQAHLGNMLVKLGLAGRKQLYFFVGQHRAAILAHWHERGKHLK